jgi:hypothetical protein
MKKKNLGVAASLVAAFFFVITACEKSTGEIGLGQVIDSKAVLGTLLELPVKSYTIPGDSIRTSSPNQELAGNYIDPYFGGVKTSFATHMVLSLLNPVFGDNPICDSVIMTMAYRGFYGDTSVPTTFVVNQLDELLDPNKIYYSNQKFEIGKEIGRLTTATKPGSRITVHGVPFAPSLRIDLDKDFFQKELINTSRLARQYFINNNEFIKHMRGIQISAEGYGGSATYFNIGSLSSVVQVFYRENPTDTVSKSYDLYFGIFTSGQYVSTNMFEFDYSLAQFNLENQDSINGEANIFVQGGGGVVTRIDLPDLKAYSDSNYLINRAELIVPVREGSVGRYFAPTNLLILREREDGQRTFLLDAEPIGRTSAGSPVFGPPSGGNLVTGKFRERTYTFNVTRTINSFINDTVTVSPIILLPQSSGSNIWRAVLNGSANPVNPIKLNIYYTKAVR